MTQMRTIESVPFAKDLAAALAVPGTDAMRVAEDFFGLADLFKAVSYTHLTLPTKA